MIFFALALFLAIMALAIAKLCRFGFATGLCLANFGIICVLYLAALAGVLLPGVILILVLAVPSVFVLALGLRNDKDDTIELIRSPAFLSYLAFVLFIFSWNHGRSFGHWDEFTHWGIVVKNMVIYDAFGNIPEATTLFRSYPPGASLYVYFFERVGGGFSESLAYMGHGILLFGVLIGIFAGGFVRYSRQNFPVFVIALIVPVIFYGAEFYSMLYVDGLLSLIFAFILVQYYSSESVGPSLSIRLSFAVATLALVKDSGTFLGAMALAIICIDYLTFSFRQNRSGLLWLLLPAMACLMARVSWVNYLNSSSMEMAWDTSRVSFTNIREFAANLPPYGKATIANFLNSFYQQFAMIVLLTGGLLFGLARVQSRLAFAKRVPLLAFGLGAGFCIYALSLLALYLFTFSTRDAVIIASFHRYMSTFALGAVLTVLGIYASLLDLSVGPSRGLVRGTSILLLVVYAPLFGWRYLDKHFDSGRTAEYLHFRELPKLLDSNVDKVYYVSENHRFTTLDFFVSRYFATPVKVESPSSFSSDADSVDEHSCLRLSPDEWKAQLESEFSHVYLYSYPPGFPKEFGSMFTDPALIATRSLYRVERSENHLHLVKVASFPSSP